MAKSLDKKLKEAYRIDDKGRLQSPGIERPDGVVPYGVKLPSMNDMLDLSAPELIELLQRYGIVGSWAEAKARVADIVGRIHGIPPGPLFDTQVRAIIENSRKGLVQTARRVTERYTTIQASTGDEKQLFVRMPEDYDPERICDICYELAGTIGTLAQHEEVGLPGAASCLGGDYCRCTLVPYED